MSVCAELLDRIEVEARERVRESLPVTPAHRPRAAKHRLLRSTLVALALAGTTSTADMLARPEPAAASCSDWMTPNYTTSNHSKACGLSIRFYD